MDPSKEKSLEKHLQSKPSSSVPQHRSLPSAAVEYLKDVQNWREKYYFTYNEEKIQRVNEIQDNLDINDLLSYVWHGDGEEVVWYDDVWNVQSITEVPEHREAKRLKTAPKEDVAEPSLSAVEKPDLNEAAAKRPIDN